MPLPASLDAYAEHIAAMTTAGHMHEPLVVRFDKPTKAIRYRQMCYNVRKLFREQGKTHNWDDLVIRVDDGKIVITQEPVKALAYEKADGTPVDIQMINPQEARAIAEEIAKNGVASFIPKEEPKPIDNISKDTNLEFE